MKNVSQIFGERMRRLRAGRPKAAFARELGIDNPSTYQNYEDGRVPCSQRVNEIATHCGVTMEWLMGGPDNPGLAAHASGFHATAHAGQSTPVAAHDLHVREHPPSYGTTPAAPLQPACRLPATCDLPHELADMKAQLATLSAQVETLTRLLGATLAANAPRADLNHKKTA